MEFRYLDSQNKSLFQHSNACRSNCHSGHSPPVAPASTITALVDSTLRELRQNAENRCPLCRVLYESGIHFAEIFNPAVKLDHVKVQYVTELTEARLILRHVKASMAQIEVKIVKGISRRNVSKNQPQESEPSSMATVPQSTISKARRLLPTSWSRHRKPEAGSTTGNAQPVVSTADPVQDTVPDVDHSQHAVSMARMWLTECRGHGRCPNTATAILPSRVLDLRNGKVRLLLTHGKEGRYMTLSHCWGGHGNITTTAQNLEAHQQEIPWACLSRTFRDAIMVTRELDCHYLWIDSLCIIQDNQQDWEKESAQMASIYENSFLTIAASRSADGEGGCCLDSGEKQYIWTTDQSEVQATGHLTADAKTERITNPDLWKPFRTIGYVAKLELNHEVLNINARRPAEDTIDLGLPLFTRAWFLQERVLSPRVLHFGPTELYWECFNGLQCECLEERMQDKEDRRSFLQRNSHLGAKLCYSRISGRHNQESLWHQLVEEYSRLKLTYEMDRLPALSGIARSQSSYLAGILPDQFPQCLYWTPESATSPSSIRRPSRYRAPSFSWASIEGPINYNSALQYQMQMDTHRVVAELRDWSCSPEGSDPYGRVADGYMKISGWNGVATVTQILSKGHESFCEIQASGQSQTFMLDKLPETEFTQISVGDEVTCLLLECGKASSGRWWQPVATYQAVVLALWPSKRVNDAFERLGLIYPSQDNSSLDGLFQAAPLWFTTKSEVTIV
ncbi:hypothetical protein NM208_g4552 [Fusarium decemcellulare]|uniref:Uncharacterized protein n=1 Tax=Fusarium decemcellulare TaxID=57161 RepID=A0ACC1SK95_9HYPO|nr:hypothetical protein NM208_g4552 [Fusarium decemcellulare]